MYVVIVFLLFVRKYKSGMRHIAAQNIHMIFNNILPKNDNRGGYESIDWKMRIFSHEEEGRIKTAGWYERCPVLGQRGTQYDYHENRPVIDDVSTC